jgi:hypothetical protein
MGEPSIARATVACLLAVVMVVGFTAAPAAAVDDGVSVSDDGVSIGLDGNGVAVDDDGSVTVENDTDAGSVEETLPGADDVPDSGTLPEDDGGDADPSVDSSDIPIEESPVDPCRDVGSDIQENVPFEQAPWFDDLPQEAQPPGVPTNLITPEVVAAIVFGATPNQCEVQDPNDPSVDPTDPPSDPNADVDPTRVGEYNDGVVALVYYEATLNESGEGPGVSGMVGGLGTSSFGDADARLTVNDGEKDYTVDPRVRYFDDGTGMAETDVDLLGTSLGVVMTCDGEECQPGTRGLPEFQKPPAIPAPTSQEDDGESEGPFPNAMCTDFGDQAQENVPFEQAPWFDDLPQEAQPPGVPTNLITPEVVAAIVFGATPNQCEVQDPNDPSVDPTDPPSDPNADVDPTRVGEYNDGVVALVYYEATLNESGEGPGVSGMVGGLGTSSFGDADARLTVNDGEKDYTVDPRVRYFDDGTGMAETDVDLLGTSLGVVMTCDGEECQPGTRGLPEFQKPPAIPAPTGQN